MPIPTRFSATPGSVRSEAPLPGAHNLEVLFDVGYSNLEIEALRASGALIERNTPDIK
jgi:crotonobetainyl-CoA:carnitine CoA-transferase CaiB-like acyl-CoA transferase